MSLFKRLGIVPIAILAAVIIGAVAGVMVLNVARGPAVTGKEDAAPPKVEEQHGALIKLNDRVVNLADPSGRRYLKIAITLELLPNDTTAAKELSKLQGAALTKKQEEITAALAPVMPKINDIITSVLSAKSFEQIASSDGKEKLKDELKQQLGKALQGEHILDVYFTDFVVQ